MYAEMVEVSHTVALADAEGERDEVVARSSAQDLPADEGRPPF
ncbi:hypothetical protein ACU61A_14550 [Pseudonocardia sichuanensis]